MRLIRKLLRPLERFFKSNYLVRSVCVGWAFPLFLLLTYPEFIPLDASHPTFTHYNGLKLQGFT